MSAVNQTADVKVAATVSKKQAPKGGKAVLNKEGQLKRNMRLGYFIYPKGSYVEFKNGKAVFIGLNEDWQIQGIDFPKSTTIEPIGKKCAFKACVPVDMYVKGVYFKAGEVATIDIYGRVCTWAPRE